MTDGFLGRWSRRKADAREGKPLQEPPAPLPAIAESLQAPSTVAPTTGAGLAATQDIAPVPQAPPPLSLEDVKTLTPESNFKPFMGPGVAPEVKNAAMKKLFADPHFNVMDRLDIYIDDYSKPNPIPESMLRQMVGAEFLMRDDAENPTTQFVAQSGETAEQPTEEDPGQPAPVQTADHAHTNLRLQPDDASGAEDPRRGTQ